MRQSLNDPNATLYNTVKQKLLDGKQVTCFTISKLDVALYCEAAKHYDFIWFEMQHSTMSFKDVETMIAACPKPVAAPAAVPAAASPVPAADCSGMAKPAARARLG